MRLLVLSDIHSNLEALEACLAAAPAVGGVANLGDIVGYGASPNAVLDRVRPLGDIFVRGNHDRACGNDTPIEDFNAPAAFVAMWTRQQLTPENRQWLRELPAGPLTDANWPDVQFVHGSPLDEDQYVINEPSAHFALEPAPFPLTFFGHTHVQGGFAMRRMSVARIEIERPDSTLTGSRVKLLPGVKYMINPGSVGQPRDEDPRAAFAVLDTEEHSIVFHRVTYDVEKAQQRILAAGLPPRFAIRLSEGR